MDARRSSVVEPEAEREVVITRIFDAPRETVRKAWTEAKHLAQWWGPTSFTNPICELDLRPGGAYRIVMRSSEDIDYPLTGVYREIVAPERLVMTIDCSEHPDAWHDMVNPKRDKSKEPFLDMLQTVTFEDLGGRTSLAVRTRFDSAAIRNGMVDVGMTEGWSQGLDRLAAQLATFLR